MIPSPGWRTPCRNDCTRNIKRVLGYSHCLPYLKRRAWPERFPIGPFDRIVNEN
jgi:hypothetical protein